MEKEIREIVSAQKGIGILAGIYHLRPYVRSGSAVRPLNSVGPDGAPALQQRLQVFCSQKVVGRGGKIDVMHRRCPGPGVGEPLPESLLKAFSKFFRLPCKDPGGLGEGTEIAGFGAESEIGHNAQALHERHRASCKIVSAGAGRIERDLDNEIRARTKQIPGPCLAGQDSRSAPLHIVAAQGDDNIIGAGQASGFPDQISVTFMERIAFRYYTCDFHSCIKSLSASGERWIPRMFPGVHRPEQLSLFHINNKSSIGDP